MIEFLWGQDQVNGIDSPLEILRFDPDRIVQTHWSWHAPPASSLFFVQPGVVCVSERGGDSMSESE